MSANLVVSAGALSFGTARTGTQSVAVTLTLTNTGDADLHLTAGVVTGQFTVVGMEFPTVVGPGGSVSWDVYFSPSSSGAQTGSIAISNDGPGPSTTVTLSGTATNGSILTQTRAVRYVGPTLQSFDIESALTGLGTLPTLTVFVLQVVDRTDSKSDVFARVANLADLTALPQGRDAALIANPGSSSFQYLSSTATNRFTDLATAVAAQKVIQDRVGALVSDWETYTNQFVASSLSILIPLSNSLSPEAVQALINAYKTAKKARGAAQSAVVPAQDLVTYTEDNLASLKALATQIQKFYQDTVSGSLDGALMRTAEITNAKTYLDTLNVASSTFMSAAIALLAEFSTLKSAGVTFLAAAGCAAGGDKTTFNNALTLAGSQITAFATDEATFQSAMDLATANSGTVAQGVSNHGTFATAINNYLTSVNSDVVAARTSYDNAVTGLTTANNAVSSALAVEAATLAAVLAVCPDFDYNSVCSAS